MMAAYDVDIPVEQRICDGFTHSLQASEVDHSNEWIFGRNGILKNMINRCRLADIAVNDL